jgi:hypothetical protein
MPSIVTASQLRSVLGVSSSLYNDAYLDDIIDTAEGVILPLLTAHTVAVTHVEIETNVAYFTTQRPHQFVVGQSVIIAGVVPSTFNGTRDVTDTQLTPYIFTQDLTNADITLRASYSSRNSDTLWTSRRRDLCWKFKCRIGCSQCFSRGLSIPCRSRWSDRRRGLCAEPVPNGQKSLQQNFRALRESSRCRFDRRLVMPPSTILDTVRQPLATAFAAVAGNVYAYVPEAPIVPFVVTVPDSPYIELETINKSTLHMKINLTVSIGVAYNSNPASLDNLEQLLISVLKVIPTGYTIGAVEKPTVTQVGPSNILVSDIRVST